MDMDRNKIVFTGLLLCVVAFIVVYALGMKGPKEGGGELPAPLLPELEQAPKEYTSRLEALEAIKEERTPEKPSLYDVGLMDSMGRYEPHLEIWERQRIVDSIYRHGRIDYGAGEYRKPLGTAAPRREEAPKAKAAPPSPAERPLGPSEAHGSFFGALPGEGGISGPGIRVLALVNGRQRVGTNGRLELRLGEDLLLEGRSFQRNSLVYGFVRLRANRVFVSLDQIGEHPVSLRAFDLQDGGEGLHVVNSFREEAQRELLEGTVQDLGIPGLPQLGGIKQAFRRSNRTVKVILHDRYRLYLKP